jgi:phosphoserine phosphatase RsbU/P
MNDLKNHPEQGLFKTIREDASQGGFRRKLRQEFRELKAYMLDEETPGGLKKGRLFRNRFPLTWWWLLRSMFFKLTPFRRIITIAGLVLAVMTQISIGTDTGSTATIDTHLLGVTCLVFVLMLELKDKLMAKEELQAGRAVQQALMPERTPRVPGWDIWLFTRPANEVGGDLVDFLDVRNGTYGIALGDVSGKGFSAALMMAKLQATLRALVPDVSSLSILASKLNGILLRDGLRNMFASLVYAELHTNGGDVNILNAGHLPPIFIHGNEPTNLPKGGAALGLISEAHFAEQPLSLDRGDRLILYSDGVTEARNSGGEFFGDARLLELFRNLGEESSADLGGRIVSAVDTFVGDAAASDDLSLAILHRV